MATNLILSGPYDIGERQMLVDEQFAAGMSAPGASNLLWVENLSGWKRRLTDGKRPAAIRLEAWSNKTDTATTNATLYSIATHPQELADDEIEAFTNADESATLTGHAYRTGDGPVALAVTGDNVLPAALQAYSAGVYIIVVDANTIKFASSLENALKGTAIAFADDGSGSGTWVIEDTEDTERSYYLAAKLLGLTGDGSITLTAAGRGYVEEYLPFDNRVKAYAFTAGLTNDDPEALSVALFPVYAGE